MRLAPLHPLHTGWMMFRGTVELGGKRATGIPVPDEVVKALGQGSRPAVLVTLGHHTYRTTVAKMGGRFLVPLSAENRNAAGVAAGDDVEVGIEVDASAREVTVPVDLEGALSAETGAREFFDALAYSHRKEWVRWIEGAKKSETRASRLTATVQAMRARRRTR